MTYSKLARHFLLLSILIQTSIAQAVGQTSAPPGEPVPDWLAWQIFQESIEFNSRQALKKAIPVAPPVPQGPLKAPARLNGFEQAMKRQFGLSAAHTGALLLSGQAYLAELQTIFNSARAEVNRRYKTPAALAAQAREPRKTSMQRAREDGLYAAVERQRERALATHLQSLARQLTPDEFTKLTQWVRTSIAPSITLSSPHPTFTNRGLPPGIVRPLPTSEAR